MNATATFAAPAFYNAAAPRLTLADWKAGNAFCFGCYDYGTEADAIAYCKVNGGTYRRVVAWEVRSHLAAVGLAERPV
jgi:hypothetical protein